MLAICFTPADLHMLTHYLYLNKSMQSFLTGGAVQVMYVSANKILQMNTLRHNTI